MKRSSALRLVLAAMFTALGILLPMAFHLLPPVPPFGQLGMVLLPMHIPVLLCGFIIGSQYGALTGFIVPLLASAITGRPMFWPIAAAMALELAAYGFFAGFLSRRFNTVISLVGAMLAGRVVMGLANVILLGISGESYGFSTFITDAFVTALPGIVIQLIIIPFILYALNRTNAVKRLSSNG